MLRWQFCCPTNLLSSKPACSSELPSTISSKSHALTSVKDSTWSFSSLWFASGICRSTNGILLIFMSSFCGRPYRSFVRSWWWTGLSTCLSPSLTTLTPQSTDGLQPSCIKMCRPLPGDCLALPGWMIIAIGHGCRLSTRFCTR